MKTRQVLDNELRFWQRLGAARAQQYRPQITEVLEDPVTGRRVKLAPGRTQRHVETKPSHRDA